MPNTGATDDLGEIRDAVRAAGLRCTPSRLGVMQHLRRATAPLTHAEIARDLAPHGFDKATVFRNLIDLTAAGLVVRTELGDHMWRFELRDRDGAEGTHPHFVCVDCGLVSCLTDVEFQPAARPQATTIGRITEILLKGYCRDCG